MDGGFRNSRHGLQERLRVEKSVLCSGSCPGRCGLGLMQCDAHRINRSSYELGHLSMISLVDDEASTETCGGIMQRILHCSPTVVLVTL